MQAKFNEWSEVMHSLVTHDTDAPKQVTILDSTEEEANVHLLGIESHSIP